MARSLSIPRHSATLLTHKVFIDQLRLFGIFLITIALAAAAGCGSSGMSSPPLLTQPDPPSNCAGQFTPAGGSEALSGPLVYVAGTSQNLKGPPPSGTSCGFIDVRRLDMSSGNLTPIQGSPFATGLSQTVDIALAPSGGFAYVLGEEFASGTCCVGPIDLQVYALDPASGAPTLKQTLATGASERSSIVMHPSGQFFYVTDYNDTLSAPSSTGLFSIQADGTVALAAVLQVPSEGAALMDPQGRFFYASTMFGGPPNNGSPTGGCGPAPVNILAFQIDSANGALTPVAGSPFTFEWTACIGTALQGFREQIDPSGQRLFVSDMATGTITAFAIDSSTGGLQALPGKTVGPTSHFSSMAMDPNGRFFYLGSPGYEITGFSLSGDSTTGTLPQLPGMPAQVVITPVPNSNEASSTIAIDSLGRFLLSNENSYTDNFSCCYPPDFLVEFRIDPNTGALTQVPSSPTTMLPGTAAKIIVRPGP